MVLEILFGISVIVVAVIFVIQCNDYHTPVKTIYNSPKSHQDALANYTAGAILMPVEEVYELLNLRDFLNLKGKRQRMVVDELCERYGVSNILALRRIQEVYILERGGYFKRLKESRKSKEIVEVESAKEETA